MTRTYTPEDGDRDDHAATRPPLNGYELVASVRVDPDEPRRGLIVLLDRNLPVPDRYVTGWVRKITDPEWNLGHYFADYVAAVEDLAVRATSRVRLVAGRS